MEKEEESTWLNVVWHRAKNWIYQAHELSVCMCSMLLLFPYIRFNRIGYVRVYIWENFTSVCIFVWRSKLNRGVVNMSFFHHTFHFISSFFSLQNILSNNYFSSIYIRCGFCTYKFSKSLIYCLNSFATWCHYCGISMIVLWLYLSICE